MLGMAKCSRGVTSSPRSSPSTCSPALVSSRAMMLPVQPMPTMTASTSFNRVAMAASSRKVRNGLRRLLVGLVAVLRDDVAIGCRQTGEADHLPRHLVAVAPMDRIGEEALHVEPEQRLEELLAVEADELRLALLERLQRLLAFLRREPVEVLALGLLRPLVDRDDAGREELARRELELITVFRLCRTERPAAIHLRAAAPGARELSIDEGDDAALGAGWRQLVRRNDGVRGGREERRLVRRQREIRLGLAR